MTRVLAFHPPPRLPRGPCDEELWASTSGVGGSETQKPGSERRSPHGRALLSSSWGRTPLPRAWPVRRAESCPPRKRPAELGELLSGKPWPSRAQEGGGQANRLCVPNPNPDSDLATPHMWAGEPGWEDATLAEAGPAQASKAKRGP